MHCGCPRALRFAGQGTAWTGPALSVLEPGGVPPTPPSGDRALKREQGGVSCMHKGGIGSTTIP